jgi:hypothetical protein
MTKHEFHIALVLLALITAGVAGHYFLNSDSGKTRSDCTLALYFSSYDGCRSSEQIEVITPREFKERIQTAFTPGDDTLIIGIEERMENDLRAPKVKPPPFHEEKFESEQADQANKK